MNGQTSLKANPLAVAEPINQSHTQGSTVLVEPREAKIRSFLQQNLWPLGLQETFLQNLLKVPIRFFICDDSSSMNTRDGHKLIDGSGNRRMVNCTRWEELSSALKFHAEVAHIALAPTEFLFLNGSTPIRVGTLDEEEETRYTFLMETLVTTPEGGTPLCAQIRSVIDKIKPLEAELRNAGQKAMVMIASDGESSDGDIVTAMQPLRTLPVWVVVRLCTDEDRIVDYWNNIDNQLELDMDVLDDLSGEAKEVYTANSWLTYGEPIHRLREFGIPIKEIDLMDTTALSADQIRRFCVIIFGGSLKDYPHPEIDWRQFVESVDRANSRAAAVWNPVTCKMTPWMDIRTIRKLKHKSRCVLS